MTFTTFLTGLLSKIIRPIISEEFLKIRSEILMAVDRREAFKQYDEEVDELVKEIENATTSEERWAVLQKFKNARASIRP